MQIITFRAATLRAALEQVRKELGPDARLLHTREVQRGWLARLCRGTLVEVAANVPELTASQPEPSAAPSDNVQPEFDFRASFRESLSTAGLELEAEALPDTHDQSFAAFAQLIDVGCDESVARDLVAELELCGSDEDLSQRLQQLIATNITTTGPLVAERGRARIVALVGPTGVGKTTTIAKLAADFRLRAKKRVGLITVDTYRIAAVDQLRTYADIIDLPMKVVGTPREMRDAVSEMADLDLILVDTAGRSPRDAVRIQELRMLLAEVAADDVYLVLSATASGSHLASACKEFAAVGTTALVFTKLDEALSLGHLLTPLAASQLPISYVTDGQNVPEDFSVADASSLATAILGSQHAAHYSVYAA